MEHPNEERLEAFAENVLDAGDRATIEAHLLGCPRCESAVDEWRYLFGALRGLPRYAPAPGFAERVLARVRVRLPWYSRVAAAFQRLLPSTTRGWALAAFIIALPIAAGGAAFAWLFSRPYVSVGEVWIFATHTARTATASFLGSAAHAFMQSDFVAAIAGWGESFIVLAGVRGLGAAAATFATLTLLSAWVLYRNLFRTPHRDGTYVTFGF